LGVKEDVPFEMVAFQGTNSLWPLAPSMKQFRQLWNHLTVSTVVCCCYCGFALRWEGKSEKCSKNGDLMVSLSSWTNGPVKKSPGTIPSKFNVLKDWLSANQVLALKLNVSPIRACLIIST